jgi:hypothetical protein
MNVTRKIVLATLLAATAALPAAAQDFNARPNFGEVTLRSGFTGDPHTIALQAGGDLNAQSISSGCSGFITSAPDVRLNFTGGDLPLILSVAARSDTTLVVNGPDGSWYCDDDGGVSGTNPAVRFNSPRTGRYEIWVGTYSAGNAQPARLHISELTSQ